MTIFGYAIAMVKIWLGLAMKTVWLMLGKHLPSPFRYFPPHLMKDTQLPATGI